MTISNSTVLIYLIKVGEVKLIKNVYKKIIITDVIEYEITKDCEKYRNEIRIFNALLKNFIIVKNCSAIEDYGLHKGENSCLSLCLEIKDKVFLSDDKKARKTAVSLGIKVVGTLGILIKNLKLKKINKKEFFRILRKLIDKGFYISTELLMAVEGYVQDNF